MRAYLAGPMTGIRDFNFPSFLEEAQKLRDMGYEVFSPAEYAISKGYDGRSPDGNAGKYSKSTGFNLREVMKNYLIWICDQAEIVIVLPRWENSKGTRAEVAVAANLGVPVISLEKALVRNPPYKEDYLIIDNQHLAFRDMQRIKDVDTHLDEHCGDDYKAEPLAQDWARVAKAAEEAGEAVKAFINYTGQNPRKGRCGTLTEVLEELGDTAFSAIFAIQHLTKDTEKTVEILDKQLQKAADRVRNSGSSS